MTADIKYIVLVQLGLKMVSNQFYYKNNQGAYIPKIPNAIKLIIVFLNKKKSENDPEGKNTNT